MNRQALVEGVTNLFARELTKKIKKYWGYSKYLNKKEEQWTTDTTDCP